MRRLRELPGSPSVARRRIAAAAFIAFFTLIVFAPVVSYEFINLDDPDYVTANDHVLRGIGVDGVLWAFSAFENGNWHPLTWLSHMLDVSFFGARAGAHHAVSLLLHTANGVLLFLFFANLTGSPWSSAFMAALFAIHPQHVESVAWVAERKDVLSSFFGLLALGAYLRQVRAPGWRPTALTATVFALCLMSKPMLVTLPFVFLLLDFWPLGRLGGGAGQRGSFAANLPALVREKAPYFLLAAGSSVVTLIAQMRGQAVSTLAALPPLDRIANALLSYGAYLYRTFWPFDLSIFYPYPTGAPVPLTLVFVMATGVVAVTATACLLHRRAPFLAVGWLWYLGTLVPVIGIIQVGAQARADRYTYFPLVGIFMIAAWGLPAIFRSRRLLATAAAVGLLSFGVAARYQVGYWDNTFTLFEHAAKVDPNNALALKNYGLGLMDQGRFEEGSRLVKQAHAMKPELRMETLLRMAVVLEKQGNIEEAVSSYQEVLRLSPADRKAGEGLERLRRLYPDRTRGEAALVQPWNPHGSAHAMKIPPFIRGNELTAAKRFEEAGAAYREAVLLQPAHADAWNNLGYVLAKLGRTPEAVDAFREAVRLRPGDGELQKNLERALADQPRRR